jgi:hypothetical protein
MNTRRLQARQDRRAPTAMPSAGRALPGAVRARMETAFGADFSDVTVREDGGNAALDAVAVTRGTEISFSPGMYDPHSPKGLEIIGHELAHVLQQRSGRVSGSGVTEVPALESEAHEAGRQAARGGPVTAPAMDARSAEAGSAQAVPSAVARGPAAGGPAQPGRVKDFFKRVFRRGDPASAPAPAPQPTRPRAKSEYANVSGPALAKLMNYKNEGLDPSPYANIPEYLAASTPPPPLPQPQVTRAPHTAPQAAANPELYAELQRRIKR